ncbi:MAG: hypothetical protein IPK18_08485 [Sphingobacteriales bacterium]|nr:MAG: hypothetical protein IPK18_08485 [Sphingobacteriales bacterium]
MIGGKFFTDYYKAEFLSGAKSRYDVTFKTGAYPPFETLLLNKSKFNIGGLSFNYGKYTYGSSNSKRKPDMAISRGTHISGVYMPNLQNKLIGYGDVNNTKDGLIMLFSEDYSTIEIFIARGMLNDISNLYNEVYNGELVNEIELLRVEAKNVFNGK